MEPRFKWIAFVEGDEKKYGAYSMDHLALVPSDGSSAPSRFKASEDLDRGVSSPRFTSDGKAIQFLVTDDRSVYPMKASLSGGAAQRLLNPPVVFSELELQRRARHRDVGRRHESRGDTCLGRKFVALTHQMMHSLQSWISASLKKLTSRVRTERKSGRCLLIPSVTLKERKVPLLLRIHGGPNAQDQHTFSAERQMFAANGYAVLAVSYRGSSGRGQKFSRAIFADWGNYECRIY